MSRNAVFVQRGIRAVKLSYMSVCVFLRIDTGVISIGDMIQANNCLIFAEIKGRQVRY